MKVREALEYTYVLVSAHGVTQALGEDAIIPAVNLALINIYNFKGYLWSRQEYREAFLTLSAGRNTLQTKYPILNPESLTFHYGSMPTTDDIITECVPCKETPSQITGCQCSCLSVDCAEIGLKVATPQNKLCPGYYQVSGGGSLGGLGGKIIKVDTGKEPNGLYVLYQRGFNLIKNADDVFPLPDAYLSAFAYMYAHFVIPPMGQSRQGDDTNFYNLAERELEYLKLRDNVFPKELKGMDGAHYTRTRYVDTFNNTGFTTKNMI